MPKEDRYKTLYKQWRNFLGLALGAVWIVYWWIRLSNEESAAQTALPAANGFWDSWFSHPAKESAIQGGFYWYMFLAVISAPLSFVVARYLARWYVDQLRDTELKQAEAAQERQLARQTADLDRIRLSTQSDAEKSQRANDRHELITRIGDVDSQLLVFETEKDQERQTRMLLNLTQFVYEIHAKFPADKLAVLLAGDDVLPKMIDLTLAHMRKLGLEDRNFYLVLKGMLPVALVKDASVDNGTIAEPSSAFGVLAPQ